MLQFFRTFFQSKLGMGLTLGILVLIAFAFASADVSNSGGFGGVAGGDRVAMVGDERVDTAALSQAATTALENLKAENPRVSMKAFLAAGGLDQVLEGIIDRTALGAFGRKHGVIASDRLVDSEIAKIPAFKGPDGKFSDAAFRQALQQRGISEKLVREDLAQGLIARQLMVPAAFGAVVPHELVTRYAALLREHRTGSIALLPSAAFAPTAEPADAELREFYTKNSSRFIRPERRVLRYATFGEAALKSVPPPSDAEIAARYNARKAEFSALETRRITQLIVPTEAAANAILAEVAKGKPLEASASGKGLAAASLGAVTKQALAAQSSQAVADASFAAGKGAVAAPARSGLGWHIMRIDAVEQRAERTLAQVREEISSQLLAEKRRVAINDLSARIEEEFDEGGNLADAAKELGLTLQSSAQITADGQVYGKPGQTAPAELARVIQTAFAMEKENEPQLAEVEAGKTFIIYDVSDIQASAPAPLAEIRGDVKFAWGLEKGAALAKAAADKVFAQASKGTDLGAAMASLGISLPPVDSIAMGREELTRGGQQVPPPLVLLFNMAEGTVKLLPAPNNRGWYVVALKDIVPGEVQASDPILVAAQRELALTAGREYAEELRRAIRAELGVKRNETAIRAVRAQLSGGN